MNAIKAVIETISDVVKTKSNGRNYLVCTVRFTEGKLAGKTYFAQRTLGENKSPISIGQNVQCMPTFVKDDVTGKTTPFFEISTGVSVNSADEIMAALGL